ncbi:Dabb family protein [Winogradskyella maritima]|nr:Dabb family protein [Winogradskyella maritima]
MQGYEWGTNNSPEGLDKGFTHAFFLTFKSEEDRAIYLPHPDTKHLGRF